MSCFVAHDTLKAHRDLFALLTVPVGFFVTEADDIGPREVLALANCNCCNSTIAIDVTQESQ